MSSAKNKLITILGPTACGKTTVAVSLARTIGAEIISADSRQVYRRMDIGTGKDIEEYGRDKENVRYHLIDIAEPGTRYNLYRYQQDFLSAYRDITSRGVQVIMCGGSGLYLESVLRGYTLPSVPENPLLRQQLSTKSLEELIPILERLKTQNGNKLHNKTDVDTAQRAIRAIEIEQYIQEESLQNVSMPTFDSIVIGLEIDRDNRRRRITRRLKSRLSEGMVDEVIKLLDEGIAPENLIYYGLEYKYITQYVIGVISYDEMFAQLEIAIHQFAKRQMTWFRGMERRGIKIHWIDAMLPMETKTSMILETLSKHLKEENMQ